MPGPDLDVVGSLAPLARAVACVVIDRNGGRRLAAVLPDPLAEAERDSD